MPNQRLTRSFLASLAVPPGRVDMLVFDTELPGFGVKASAGGSRQFIVQYRPVGARATKRLTIGRVGVLSLEEARRQARLVLAKAQTGSDPQKERAAARARSAVTLGSVADAYLSHAEKRQRPGTLYQTRLHLTRHWEPLRALPVDSVRRIDVAARLNELARSSGGVSANRSRSALSAMFAWAIAEGLADANPVAGTNKPAEERSRERVLTPDELRSIWGACGDDDHGRIVKLLILTGQRREEVGGITADEIDLDAAEWTLPAARAKNKREHLVPLSAEARSLLLERPRVAGRLPIFGEGATGFSGWSRAKARLDARIAAAGAMLAHWTLHDLRRTAATMMADRLAVPPHIVETILNHTSGHRAGVAGVYNRASYRAEKRDALTRWGDEVARIVGANGGVRIAGGYPEPDRPHHGEGNHSTVA